MLDWLYTAVAWAMKQWHGLLSTFLDPASGTTWALAIAALVMTIRVLLLPLFARQVASRRAMQELRPELAELEQRHGTDRQAYQRAVLALQKERGVNPLAGCLPALAQLPVFVALLHVLRRITPDGDGLYSWSDTLTDQAARAELLGAPISSSFSVPEGAGAAFAPSSIAGTWVPLVLIVAMCATTFVTQKQFLKRSGPAYGQAATVQNLLLYGMPISLFVTGFFFPVGVLVYWLTNNLWTLGQQACTLTAVQPGPAASSGEGADDPRVRSSAAAPRPGAKPVRPAQGGSRPTAGAAAAARGGSRRVGASAARSGSAKRRKR